MDVVGSEIGQKMRSAIKAKLTELGCYVDDELPDYVMVMVANKRTRTQMEDDLQLFLGDNTTLFVNWLHQVLKKLQEVTVATPLKNPEHEVSTEMSSSKEKKSKDRSEKAQTKKAERLKKAKKKEKAHRKKEEKKIHKSKKKSKHHEMIRPNVPPLLMNIEKVSEPSITDVFAGQILKSHGITLDSLNDEPLSSPVIPDVKPVVNEIKRPIVPIIDPATISSQPDPDAVSLNTEAVSISRDNTPSVSSVEAPKEEQLKEINDIEAKIQGLKQKLAEQLDSMSEDEDFLNIRTEAEELMNDFAEDVFQEISQQAPVPAPLKLKSPSPTPEPAPKPVEIPKTVETLPQIELKLPKRPIRERLGVREEPKKAEVKEKEPEKRTETPERFTPERVPDRPTTKSVKSRLSDHPEKQRASSEDDSEKSETSTTKRLSSRVSVLGSRDRVGCASVVRVRPRPRVGAPASSLLLRAVADAHKSLLNIPPKIDQEPQMVKRALVLPMRRVGDPKIVIQVPGSDALSDNHSDNISLGDDSEDEKASKLSADVEKQEYTPKSLTMKIKNTNYVPATRNEGRTACRRDDSLVIETINIHNPTVDKDKNTQFIVTMDGFNPNSFLAKKLRTEGLLNDEDEVTDNAMENTSVLKKTEDSKTKEGTKSKDSTKTKDCTKTKDSAKAKDSTKAKDSAKTKEDTRTKDRVAEKTVDKPSLDKKRLSNESEESETQVIIKQESEDEENVVLERTAEKRKSDGDVPRALDHVEVHAAKKRKASPIVFDVRKKEKEVVKERERTESVSSDSHVIVTTATNSHKYDSVPPLSSAERKSVWCRSFPLCRYGSACAFQHPKCKFMAACTRRGCVYTHAPVSTPAPPTVSSHVVPAANYKSISAVAMPSMCKFYPNCVNPGCAFYHPKPCRYGAACHNQLECNFYHPDSLATKWRYPV